MMLESGADTLVITFEYGWQSDMNMVNCPALAGNADLGGIII